MLTDEAAESDGGLMDIAQPPKITELRNIVEPGLITEPIKNSKMPSGAEVRNGAKLASSSVPVHIASPRSAEPQYRAELGSNPMSPRSVEPPHAAELGATPEPVNSATSPSRSEPLNGAERGSTPTSPRSVEPQHGAELGATPEPVGCTSSPSSAEPLNGAELGSNPMSPRSVEPPRAAELGATPEPVSSATSPSSAEPFKSAERGSTPTSPRSVEPQHGAERGATPEPVNGAPSPSSLESLIGAERGSTPTLPRSVELQHGAERGATPEPVNSARSPSSSEPLNGAKLGSTPTSPSSVESQHGAERGATPEPVSSATSPSSAEPFKSAELGSTPNPVKTADRRSEVDSPGNSAEPHSTEELATSTKSHNTEPLNIAEASEEDIAELESAEEPDVALEPNAVLTDEICLIPGDKPVVRIEDAPGNARRIFTGVDIGASVDEVWAVMTDYDGLERVVPNLVDNKVLCRQQAGGARLKQTGRASWEVFGRHLYFQAGTTLDVTLHPEGLPEEMTAGKHIDAAALTSAEVRARGLGTPLVRDVFPRPFSIPGRGIPVRDITMQNVLGAKGDFVHYQGIWRLQPLYGCAPPGEQMMRLTFAVECEPHWFLPVAPVEGRIATALAENMEAIRDYVEGKRKQRAEAGVAAELATDDSPSLTVRASLASAGQRRLPRSQRQLSATGSSAPGVAHRRRRRHKPMLRCMGVLAAAARRLRRFPGASNFAGRARAVSRAASSVPLSVTAGVDVSAITDAMAQTLERAEAGTMSRPVVGAATGWLAQVAGALATAAEVATGIEAEMLLAGSVAAALAAFAATNQNNGEGEVPQADGAGAATLALVQPGKPSNGGKGGDRESSFIPVDQELLWQAVCEHNPAAVDAGHFMGRPVSRQDVDQRWPRFVEALGITEQRAMEFIQMDSSPLLVHTSEVADVFNRLADVSSRDQALELIGWNPGLLVGKAAAGLKVGADPAASLVYDVMYAARLLKVLEDPQRSRADKVLEIQLYSWAVLTLKPLLDVFEHGGRISEKSHQLCRRPWRYLAQVMPHSAVRVFLRRVVAAPDPMRFIGDQATAGAFMAQSLIMRPYLATSILPYSPSILPHLPAIYTNLSILRPHVPGIVRILDPYFGVVEPHLDRIMERMDQIEPHLPYILLHLDVLAKHCGPLLDHFDALMPYASKANALQTLEDWETCYDFAGGDAHLSTSPKNATLEMESCMVDRWDEERPEVEIEMEQRSVSYLPRLLPYVDFLVPLLDEMAPHLPLVHPHLPYLLPYLNELMPYIPLFKKYPRASANADVLIGYLGWMLKLPVLPKVLYVPGVPPIIAFFSGMLPRGLVRRSLEDARRKYDQAMAEADEEEHRIAIGRAVRRANRSAANANRSWRRKRFRALLRLFRWRRAVTKEATEMAAAAAAASMQSTLAGVQMHTVGFHGAPRRTVPA